MPRNQKMFLCLHESLSTPVTAALKWTADRKAICVFHQCRYNNIVTLPDSEQSLGNDVQDSL
jgi:hypothetical protein